ncbi:hypothetical protein WR25_20006 [Diploscapter pachys]|uniref:RNA helicase n=1 Tax=Diploscapter pachys TaxID=2018661 RepID=A0A2A2LE25_9BILA|nr:hypothetical protein WR25_20006 [Diploscapter pachys]
MDFLGVSAEDVGLELRETSVARHHHEIVARHRTGTPSVTLLDATSHPYGVLLGLLQSRFEGGHRCHRVGQWISTMSDSSDNELDEQQNEEVERKIVTQEDEPEQPKTFADLGVVESLCEECVRLGWNAPTKIQLTAIPAALQGRDIIGLAETGSGKTAAFALPILQSLLEKPQKLFALVLTPTRELAIQIAEQFIALGSGIGLVVAVIVGGQNNASQAIDLAKRPHIIVATPGRLVDHLENTKGFNLKALKFLVLDEADRMLNSDFESQLDKIIRVIPKDRRTYLFSATMTNKVAKLGRASLKNPVRVEVNTRYKTVDKLRQHYILMPNKYKEAYLVYLLQKLSGNTCIVFCSTCNTAMLIAVMLRQLGMQAVPLHGKMGQEKRLASLNKFKSKARNVLVCTDVASRGLDIPHVDMVVNYDVPGQAKDYIHRVGRTARAGRAGLAITFVTQYDAILYQKIEAHIGKKLAAYECEENLVMKFVERTQEAIEAAKEEIKETENTKKRKKGMDSDDDTEETVGKFKRKKLNNSNKRVKHKAK